MSKVRASFVDHPIPGFLVHAVIPGTSQWVCTSFLRPSALCSCSTRLRFSMLSSACLLVFSPRAPFRPVYTPTHVYPEAHPPFSMHQPGSIQSPFVPENCGFLLATDRGSEGARGVLSTLGLLEKENELVPLPKHPAPHLTSTQ